MNRQSTISTDILWALPKETLGHIVFQLSLAEKCIYSEFATAQRNARGSQLFSATMKFEDVVQWIVGLSAAEGVARKACVIFAERVRALESRCVSQEVCSEEILSNLGASCESAT